MMKIRGCKLVLLASLVPFCLVASSFAQKDNSPRQLISAELLKTAELEVLWEDKLPIRKQECLEQLFILGNRIYALSDRNYMVSLNREKGNTVFSRLVAPLGFPVVGLELYKDELFSVVGNRLVKIDPHTGTELSTEHLKFVVTCSAVRNSSYFYLSGTDRRMHALRAEDNVQIFEVSAGNNSMITSIVADEDFVLFATDVGNVIRIAPDKPKKLWQFDADGAIAGSIVRDGNSLFVASKDTNVYKIDLSTGKPVWKYQAGAVLESCPQVTEGVVYQSVGDKGLAAIDRKSSGLIWQLAEGTDLLAEVNGKAYVITNSGKLVVMDNTKAKSLYSIDLTDVSKYVVNVVDSKIYIADNNGYIACLKPIE